MDRVEELLAEYIVGNISEEQGMPITRENYERIIALLQEKEEKSYGLLKMRETIKFLREWFGK